MNTQTKEWVIALIRRICSLPDSEPLSPDTRLLSGGLALDSVLLLDVILAVEQEFDLELDPEALIAQKALQSIGSLIQFIEHCRQVEHG